MWERNLNLLFQKLWGRFKSKRNYKEYVVLDLGANFGAFTLFAASCEARVVSFEMQPYVAAHLDLSIRASGYSHLVTLHQTALWNQDDVDIEFFSTYGFLAASIINSTSIEASQHVVSYIASGKGTVDVLHTKSKKVDSLVYNKKIFFLKLDVEESEKQVMEGMSTLLVSKSIRHFVFEAKLSTFEFIGRQVYDAGYKFCRLFDEKKDNCVWPNLDKSCYFYNYEDFVRFFTTNSKRFEKGRMSHGNYVDVHCFIGNTKAPASAVRRSNLTHSD
jgi:FkbM family methyltransferase